MTWLLSGLLAHALASEPPAQNDERAPPRMAVATVAGGIGDSLVWFVGAEYRTPITRAFAATARVHVHPQDRPDYRQSLVGATVGLQALTTPGGYRSTAVFAIEAGPALHQGFDDLQLLLTVGGGVGGRFVGRYGELVETTVRVMGSVPLSYRDPRVGSQRVVHPGRGIYLELSAGAILEARDGWERGSFARELASVSDARVAEMRERARSRRLNHQILTLATGAPWLGFAIAGMAGSELGLLAVPLTPAVAWGAFQWQLGARRMRRADTEWTRRETGDRLPDLPGR